MYPKLLAFTALIFSSSIAFAQQSDEDAIKQVITTSYIEGIQNRGSSESIRKGFHPSFHMLRFVDNDVKPLSIEEWITNIENSKAKNEPAQPRAVWKFVSVDITGTAAIVKLDLYRNAKHTFTDYLVLYKFTEGWKIVGKTYYRYPQ